RPETDQPFLERSLPRCGLALAGHELRARNVFIPGEVAADRVDVRVLLSILLRALDLHAVSRDLVVRLDSILRQHAGLTAYLDRAALGVIVERFDQLGLGAAPERS